VTIGLATAADAFGVIVTNDAPALFQLGTTTVTWTATDPKGNTATATQLITITPDVTAPVFTLVPGPVSKEATASAGTVVELGDAVATDAFGVTVTNDAPALFQLGTTTVTWTATDATGNSATATQLVTIVDTTAPVITADDREVRLDYVDPDYPIWGHIHSPVEYDYAANVTALDGDDPVVGVICEPVPRNEPNPNPAVFGNLGDDDFTFSDMSYTIQCTATDDAGNVGTASYELTVNYLYRVEFIASKLRVKLGSTVPLDWFYSEWDDPSSVPVDSLQIADAAGIRWDSTTNCEDVNGSGPSGEDSGSSDFRYSASSDTWQYSLQTKDLTKGKYLVSVRPPGVGVASASVCITLR